MTIEEVRDDVAKMFGWKSFCTGGSWSHPNQSKIFRHHPVPDTIDGVAKLWPEGWCITVFQEWQTAFAPDVTVWRVKATRYPQIQYVPAKGEPEIIEATEYEARLRLLHAVLLAARGAGREGQGA